MHKSLYKNLFIDFKLLSLPLKILNSNSKFIMNIKRTSSLRKNLIENKTFNIHSGKIFRKKTFKSEFGKIGTYCLTRSLKKKL